jgi:hypothetical protein
MAYGLEVRNAAGAVTLTITSRVGFFIGKLTGVVAGSSSVVLPLTGVNVLATRAFLLGSYDSSTPLEVTIGANQVTIQNADNISQSYAVLLADY